MTGTDLEPATAKENESSEGKRSLLEPHLEARWNDLKEWSALIRPPFAFLNKQGAI